MSAMESFVSFLSDAGTEASTMDAECQLPTLLPEPSGPCLFLALYLHPCVVVLMIWLLIHYSLTIAESSGESP